MKPIKVDILLNDKTQESWNKVKKSGKEANEAVEQAADKVRKQMQAQAALIEQLKAKIADMKKRLAQAPDSDVKKQLTAELQVVTREVEVQEKALEKLGHETETTAQKQLNLRQQIAKQREAMNSMTEGTEEYTAAMERLGSLLDRQGDINKQGAIHSDDQKHYRAVADAVAGLSGAMSAGIGVASLFGAKEEELAKIQTKLQAIMAVTIGLQQVAQTLNKDSYFQYVLMVGIKKKWAAAQALLNVQLGISVGLSKLLMATGVGLLIAGIGALVAVFMSWREEQKKLAEEQQRLQEAIKGASSGMGEQIATLKSLQEKWAALGDDLKKRKKFVEENKEAFDKLGVSVKTVADADNLLIKNTDAFITSLVLRTRAMAAQKLAQEEYEKALQKRVEAEDRRIQPFREEDYAQKTVGYFRGYAVKKADKDDVNTAGINRENAAKKIEEEADAIEKVAKRYLLMGEEAEKQREKLLENSHITSADDAAKEKEAAEKAKREAEKAKQTAKERQQANETILEGEYAAKKKIEEMRLALEKEGVAKRKLVAKKELDDTLYNIRKERDARIKALQEAKEKGVRVTQEQFASVHADATAMEVLAQDGYKKQVKDIQAEEEKMLLSQYRDYTAKRLSIEEHYRTEVERIDKAMQDARERGDEKTLAALASARRQAVVEQGKALMSHDFEVLRSSPEYIRAFEDLGNTSSATLQYLVQQMETYKAKAAQTLNPEDLREYTRTIEQMQEELSRRDPFRALAESIDEAAAKHRKLEQLLSLLGRIRAGEQVVKDVQVVDGKRVLVYYTEAEALQAVAAAQDDYLRSINKMNKARKEVVKQVDELAQAITRVGDTIGGEAGEVLRFIGDITQFVTSSIENIQLLSQAGAKALSAVEKASVILAIVSAAIQVLRQLSALIGDSHEQYKAMAERQKETNKMTTAVREYALAVKEAEHAEKNWFSTAKLGVLRQAREMNAEVIKSYYAKLNEQQATYVDEKGGGWFTNVYKWLYNNTYGRILGQIDRFDPSKTLARENLRIETRKRSRGFLGTGIGGHNQQTQDLQAWLNAQEQFGGKQLFDELGLINKELAQTVIRQFGDKLVGETKETLETLIELREKYDLYKTQLQEYVSELYSPLVDNLVSSLWEWFDSGKDALDSFKKYASQTFRDIVSDMIKTVVLDKVFGSFQKDIADFYGLYSAKEIDEKQLIKQVSARIAELTGSFEAELPLLQELMNNVQQIMAQSNIDLGQGGSRQAGQVGVINTITQDQGTKLEGIMTSLQDHASSIDEKLSAIAKQMTASVAYLREIAENTHYCRRLAQIEGYLERMTREGIKIK